MSNCPFCTKKATFYLLETAHFASIYNISPILPGHSLVVPKRHVESLFLLTEQELAEFMYLGRSTARLLALIYKTDAFDWAIQEKEAAGQSVPHLHIHVVPRTLGDLADPGDWYQELEKSNPGTVDTYDTFRLTENQLTDITERIKGKAAELGFKP